ncbi:acyl-CoA dehydrogenase family protein [Clostridium estertheticum]|uniref:acyl-CoA dehydrogenase family protein n=1 Tax=Clostridium estertheticum TaxID=238834 RepID=UPI001C0B1FD1|nr:acyl-CoA dehydrogenase family protein [Clostridium estertheticum]MBU3201873.1 acyl-CoA dehydrogenase family protein [Clostridium estertheticum]WAG67754.1 acyl-CoA dehydrogenase family protein [Clostridium estertheticum]
MANILTDEQKDLVEMVRDFAANEIKPHIKELDITGEFPLELLKKAIDMGLHTLEIPEKDGGAGLDFQTTAAVFEELAKVDAGYAITLVTNFVALRAVNASGNEMQKKLFADIIIPGGYGSFCLTEPNAGSDAGALKTTAAKDGDEYVLNGRKCFVTNGGFADVYVVFASTNKDKRIKGISAFIVEKSRLGITVGKHEDKMGLRLSNTCDVVFDDVRVPADHLIGKEGEGFKVAMQALNVSRAFVGTLAVGICQAAIDESVKYAKERIQFGKPIAQFEAIQMILADMEIQTEAARQLVHHSMILLDEGKDIPREGAITKTFCGDTVMKVTTDAVQIFGGYGVCKDYPVEKLMRDAKVFQIFEGTNQIQRIIISREMIK